MPSERTPLAGSVDHGPPYVFVTNPNRVYRKQIREFQCCVCATILLIVLTALVASITYSVDNDDIDVPTNNTNSTPVAAPNLTLTSLLAKSWPLPDAGEGAWKGPALTAQQLQEALVHSEQEIERINSQASDGPALPVDSPSYRHQQSIRTSMEAAQLAKSGLLSEVATKHVSQGAAVKGSIGKGPAFKSCDDGTDAIVCPSSPYRSYDGLCNNLKHKAWGAGMQSFKRELAPDYADGISAPRAAADGSPLPSAREVSVTVHRPVYRDDPKFTVMLAVWGQFMDHDVTATALSKGKNGGTITCCGVAKELQNPACYPVQLSAGDDYYHKYNMTCMEFVRSSPAPSCTLGPREQLNQVSSYLDGSVVHGNTEDLARRLRTFSKGELRMFLTPDGRELLPVSTDPQDGCNEKEQNAKGRYCFMTGDARANENTHLTSMHLLLARQHNTLARQLATLNPDWDDETLYQESRKILAAQMQHVTYNEFLPVLLGPTLMSQLKLSPQKSGYSRDYNPDVDPTISNNFATSAFRFAHTLIPGLMKVIANDTSSVDYVELHKMLFNPYEIYSEQGLDKTLQGAMNTNVERADNYFTTQLTQHLFEQVGSKVPYGLDLVSLNIQRGRDHGLPGYPKWRKYCGLSEPKSFEDLKDHVDEESLQLLAKVYKSVDDVDMYTGGLSEKPLEGGLLGPTMTCLIANQFVRMKAGDRYWYETPAQPEGFTAAQLDEIRKTSLAGIICQNSDHVTYSQRKVMELVDKASNPRVSCVEIAQPDLTHWTTNQKQTLKASAPVILSNVVKFGSKVVSGNAVLNGQQIWDGKLPVEIPLSVENKGHRELVWSGTLNSVSLLSAELTGQFSSASGNGSFKLDLELFWNSTKADVFSTSGNVTLIFADRGNMSALLSSQLLASSAQTSKVILFGQYVKNDTAFIWSGNSTSILVERLAVDPAVYFQTKSAQLLLTDSLVYENTALVKFGSKVVSGNAVLNGQQIWDGKLPVEIPLSVENKGHRELVWSGTLNSVSLLSAELSGQFSSASGNGSFKLDLELFWNSTKADVFSTSGKVTLIFADRENMAALLSSQLLASSAQTSKVILFGQYVKNDTAFIWSGNSTSILVERLAVDPAVYFETKSAQPLVADSLVYENPAFGVSNGHLSVNDAMVWSGVTPVAIPVKSVVNGNKTHAFGYTAKFRGVLQGNNFVGNFSIPDYKTGVKLAGEISLELVQLNLPASSALFSNVDYNAKILFRESDGSSVVDWARNTHTWDDDSSWSWFLTSSKDSAAKSIAIVLQGMYSADKTTFSWSGNFVVYSHEGTPLALTSTNSLKSIDDDKDKAKADDKANKGTVYGIHVSSATITGGLDGAPAVVLHDGPFPAMMYIGDVFEGVAAWLRTIPVTWKGELTGDVLTGNYSTQFKGHTLEGTFTADIVNKFIYKPFPTDLISPSTEYTSAVSLKQYNSLGSSMNTLTVPTKASSSSSVTIVGTFSPDSTSFYFPGDLTFTVGGTPTPDPDPKPNALTLGASSDAGDKTKTDDKKKKDKKPKDGKKKAESVGVMVKYAHLTSGLNGSNPQTVFDGKPPLMSEVGNMFAGLPSWQRSINVLWTSKISGNKIEGNYSTVVQGKLYAGSFSAQLAPMWVPTLDLSVLKSDTYYSTSFLFTQWGKSSGAFTSIEPTKPVDDSMLKLFSSAQQLTLGAIDSSVILVGTFSPDASSFYWPGSLRFIKTPPAVPAGPIPDSIPTPTPAPTTPAPTSSTTGQPPVNPAVSTTEQPPSSSEPSDEIITNALDLGKSKPKKVADDVIPKWFKGKLIAKVLGGYVSASLENRPTEQWWYESLPVDLPSNPFWAPTSDVTPAGNGTVFSHGIIWSATDVGEYNIQGTFSMPQYVRSAGNLYTVQWYNGNFNLRFSPLWNSLMASQFVELNVKYYSPLHFQSTTNPILEAAPSQDVINSARPAPIILLGNVTADRFSWGGSAIIAFY